MLSLGLVEMMRMPKASMDLGLGLAVLFYARTTLKLCDFVT